MKKLYCLVLVITIIAAGFVKADTSSQAPNAPVRFETNSEDGLKIILELLPLSFLFSPDIDGFTAYEGDEYDWYTKEEIEGIGSWTPNGRAGISIGMDRLILDITGGGGYLWNEAFSGPFYLGDFAARFKINDSFTIGPHVGLLEFGDMDWSEDADLDISGSSGWMAGLVMTGGRKNFYGFLSLDYVNAELDVEPGPGWTTNEDTLDLTGFAVQVGIAWRF